MFAEPGAALLIDFEDHTTQPGRRCGSAGAGLALLVTDTRVSHALVDGGYGARRADCEAAAAPLGRRPRSGTPTSPGVEALDDEPDAGAGPGTW